MATRPAIGLKFASDFAPNTFGANAIWATHHSGGMSRFAHLLARFLARSFLQLSGRAFNISAVIPSWLPFPSFSFANAESKLVRVTKGRPLSMLRSRANEID
jgi:hypothetical protein